jgi:hypothetical protein
MVRRRVRVAQRLRASLKTDAAKVARGLEERMAKVLEPGEEPPDIQHLLNVLGRMMVYEAKELEGSEDWRFDETWSLEDLQREYRATIESFRSWLVGLRKQMRGLIGDDETRHLLELGGRTPRSQEELAGYAGWLYGRMATWKLPKLRYSAVASHRVWRRELKPMALKLQELERRMFEQDSDRAEALDTRDGRLASVARDLRRALRFAQLAYLLAGEDIMASRLEAALDRILQSRTVKEPAATAAEPAEAATERRDDPAERRWWHRPARWLGSWWARGRRGGVDPAD